MELRAIRQITVERLNNYSDGRVRVAWQPRDGAVGYNIYASHQPYEPLNKINSAPITENYFDIIPPRSPIIEFYVWVRAIDSDNRESVYAKRGVSWQPQDIGFKSQIGVCSNMDYYSTDTFLFDQDPYFRDVANNVVWPRPGTRLFNRPVTGDQNDVNKVFATEFNYKTGTLVIVKNGRDLHLSDYTEIDSRSFELIEAPTPTDEIMVCYTVAD